MKTQKQNLVNQPPYYLFLVLLLHQAISLNADPFNASYQAKATQSESSFLMVRARGTKAGGIKIINLHLGGEFAHFKVYVNDKYVGSSFTSSSFENYKFSVPFALDDIEEVRVYFDNDAVINGRDRNLFVESIRMGIPVNSGIKGGIYDLIGSTLVEATTENVTYRRNSGNVVPYKGVMLYSGLLIFNRKDAGLTVRARGSQVDGVYPYFKVYVNDEKVGEGFAYSSFKPYTFALPIVYNEVENIKVTFDNDAFENGHDRNLYVGSISIGWKTILATTDNVIYKKRDGNTTPYKGAMYWNGELIFDEKYAGLIVNAKSTHVEGIFSHFRVYVNDQKVGETFTSLSNRPYEFDLPFAPSEVEKVRITFDNDAFENGQDRNLLVQSIRIGWSEILATTENVIYKRTNGSITTYKGAMYWNGDLIFDIGVESSTSARMGDLNNELTNHSYTPEPEFTIYPNPNNGIFNVDLSGVDAATLNLEIIDQAGRSVFNKQLESIQTQTLEMNLHSLPNGIYFLRVSTDTFAKVQRIVKN